MATDAIKVIDRAIRQSGKFRNVRGNVGVVVIRKIRGTDLWSQHSYGNATDYYGTREDLTKLYNWLIVRRGILPLAAICYNHRGGCTTPHTGHLHVDALPRHRGTPPGAPGNTGIRRPLLIATPRDALRDELRDLAGTRDSIGDLLLGPGERTPIVSGIMAVPDFLALLADPKTYLRALLLIGGTALTLMGIAALLSPTAATQLANLPGPVGSTAKLGSTIGGNK